MATQNLLKLLLLLMLMMRNSLLQGGAEGGLPKKSFGGQAAGFCRTSLLGFKDLHAVILTNRCSGETVEEVPQYHHRPSSLTK